MSESSERIAAPPATSIDYNGDGTLTFVDVASWLYDCFFLHGDWALWAIATYAPPVAAFFDVGPVYHGTGSAFLSALAWLAVFIGGSIAYHAVREADRRITRALVNAYAGLTLRVRIAFTLAKAWWRRRKVVRAPAIEAVAIELSPNEERVLELHATLRAGYALTPSDVARALSMRVAPATALLEQLQSRQLLVRVVGGADGEDAYALTALGRAYTRRTRDLRQPAV